jgi:TonB family protein
MRKIEFLNKDIKVSDKDIESFMDFDAVLDKSRGQSLNNQVVKTLTKRFVYVLGALALIGISYWFYDSTDNKDSTIINEPELNEPLEQARNEVPQSKLIMPVDTISVSEAEVPEPVKESEGNVTIKKPAQKPVPPEKATAKQGDDQLSLFAYVDAEPVDGIENLYEYFDLNLKYPVEALTDSIEGSVVVRFTVTEEGKIDNIIIQKSLGDAFDIEAIRLIENMPPWKPATVNQIPISSKLSVPLHFRVK